MNSMGQGAITQKPGPLKIVPEKEETHAGLLDSWKEIARYLGRDVRTVQRWEKSENLPVHRHIHRAKGSVYAFKAEIEMWRTARAFRPSPVGESKGVPQQKSGGPKECHLSHQFGLRANALQRIIWKSVDSEGQTVLVCDVGVTFGPGVLDLSCLA